MFTGAWLLVLAAVASLARGYRLPDNLAPSHYTLEIVTHLDDPDFYFTGKVMIKMDCIKATQTVVLHALKLNISEKEVTLKEVSSEAEAVDLKVQRVWTVPSVEQLMIRTETQLRPSRQYVLTLQFRGELSEGLTGFYRSKYHDSLSNSTKWLAVTQFESTEARKAFPCFDEPAMKARFTISLGRKEHLKTVSNMPIKATRQMEGKDGWEWDDYEDTVPMSTYLVAFLVGELESRAGPRSRTQFRVWARHDAFPQTAFAAQIGPSLLEYYEDYFRIKYPLPKQDMVAIPDFSAGAMENWGLITYRETALLYDEDSSSAVDKHSIASVVAHELAHQWFGNLVTMKWWTDLWLNEGFATYVAEIGVHHEFPSWNTLEYAWLDNMQTVLILDSLNSSHPVSVQIGHPSEIGQIFDTISYKKGSALLRMMAHFLGEKAFQGGVCRYLEVHRFSNADKDDLWKALTDEAHAEEALPQELSVKTIMDTWTVQTGYPLVTVTRDYEQETANVTQMRYLQLGGGSGSECWWVPISYIGQSATPGEASNITWLNCKENKSIVLSGLPDKNTWVLFNPGGAGLYRVQYDERNWRLLAATLNSPDYSLISSLDRAQLVMNALELAWRGDMEYPLALSLVAFLKRDSSFIPWKAALSSLKTIDRLLRRTSNFGPFKKMMRGLLEPMLSKYGDLAAVPNSLEEVRQHNAINWWACKLEVGECSKQAMTLFHEWVNSKSPDTENPVASDLRQVVYCVGARNGGEAAWDFLWERYQACETANEKSTILASLACSKEIWILNRFLEWSIDPSSGIRKQDSTSIFSNVVRSDLGFYVGKQFFFRNIAKIYKYHGERSNRPARYLTSIGEVIISTEEKNEWSEFLKKHKDLLRYTALAARQSVETAEANSRWAERSYATLGAALKAM